MRRVQIKDLNIELCTDKLKKNLNITWNICLKCICKHTNKKAYWSVINHRFKHNLSKNLKFSHKSWKQWPPRNYLFTHRSPQCILQNQEAWNFINVWKLTYFYAIVHQKRNKIYVFSFTYMKNLFNLSNINCIENIFCEK